MRDYFYYNVLRHTIIMFLDAFNDIQIARYHPDTGAIVKRIEVPLKLWAKEKAWYWINEQAKMDEVLPIISAEILSIVYDTQRQTNPLQYIVNSTAGSAASAGQNTRFLNPVPYNISFSLRIWALYMVDIDQILEQILPYFAPAIQLKINISELSVAFDAKVVFEAASPEIEAEYADEERRVVKWNLDFIVQTYMFKPVETKKIVKSIFINEHTDEAGWAARRTDTMFTSGASATEAKSIIAYAPYYDEDGKKLYNYELYGSG